jgi:hypothetical protein
MHFVVKERQDESYEAPIKIKYRKKRVEWGASEAPGVQKELAAVETQLEAFTFHVPVVSLEVRKSSSMNRKVVACCLQDLNFVYCQGFTDIKSGTSTCTCTSWMSSPCLVEGIRMVTGQSGSR